MALSTEILTALTQSGGTADLDEIARLLNQKVSKRTLQRQIVRLIQGNKLVAVGKGRARVYQLPAVPGPAPAEEKPLDVENYERFIGLSEEALKIRHSVRQPRGVREPVGYEREFLFSYAPNATYYLSEAQRAYLATVGDTGEPSRPAGTHGREILNRLLIDLSWASSRLEGNTYTRLDTERLIQHGETVSGKDAQETQMILNHKAAIEFIVDEAGQLEYSRYTMLNLHGLLSENLMPDPDASGRLRVRPVDIGGSVYVPTAIPQVIEEAFNVVLAKTAGIQDPFEQAFFIMVHIPYLQPFEDVNKRVSRLAANIPLLKHNLSPLTFIDLPERAYVDATLGVYELRRVELLRDLFIWAYERSAKLYGKVQKSLAEPEPIRLRYREPLHEIVGQVVRERVRETAPRVRVFADAHIVAVDRDRFVEIALDDLRRLHFGVLHRYRIRPSEFESWQQALSKTAP